MDVDVDVDVTVDMAMVLSVVMACHGNSETEIHSHRIHMCTHKYINTHTHVCR